MHKLDLSPARPCWVLAQVRSAMYLSYVTSLGTACSVHSAGPETLHSHTCTQQCAPKLTYMPNPYLALARVRLAGPGEAPPPAAPRFSPAPPALPSLPAPCFPAAAGAAFLRLAPAWGSSASLAEDVDRLGTASLAQDAHVVS